MKLEKLYKLFFAKPITPEFEKIRITGGNKVLAQVELKKGYKMEAKK